MASPPSLPASGAEERFDKAKKHLWQVIALSLSLTVGLEMRTACNNASSCVSKSANSVAIAPSIFLLSLIACNALMLTPHFLATGTGWFIIHRASDSPAHEENQTDRPAERRELGVKSPSPEYFRMRPSHSATPHRPRSPQLTEKPQRAPSKFVFFSLFCMVNH
jgi:hypothetical protein